MFNEWYSAFKYCNEYVFKLSKMQEELTVERTNGIAGRNELDDWKARVEQMKGVLGQLEEDKLRLQHQLQKQNSELTSKLDEQGSTFRAQVCHMYISLNFSKFYFSSNQKTQRLIVFKET